VEVEVDIQLLPDDVLLSNRTVWNWFIPLPEDVRTGVTSPEGTWDMLEGARDGSDFCWR
jgi:hypothetical protein